MSLITPIISSGTMSAPARLMPRPALGSHWWEYELVGPILRSTPGTTSTVTDGDRVYHRVSGGATYSDYQINVEVVSGSPGAISFASSDTDVATVNASGRVTHISDGSCTITVTDAGNYREVNIPLTLATDTDTIDTYMGGATGTVRRDAERAVDGRINLLTPEEAGCANSSLWSVTSGGTQDSVDTDLYHSTPPGSLTFSHPTANRGIILTRFVELQVGRQYTLTAWIYGDGVGQWRPVFHWHNSAEGYHSSTYGDAVTATQGWQKVFVTATPPAGNNYCRPGVYRFSPTGTSYTLWVDDVVLFENTLKDIYITQNHSTATYVRNPHCWAARDDLDLTCISPWNSQYAHRFGITAVSPLHAIGSKHAGTVLAVGTTVRFVAADNTVITRTIAGREEIDNADLVVYKLSAALPSEIGFAKVLPANWADYILDNGADIPVLALDQEEKALVKDISSLAGPTVSVKSPTNELRSMLNETLIVGDSSNPCFLIIDGELVLLNVWWTPSTGSSVHYHADAINAAMTTLGGGYELTEADLSEFADFS